MAKATLQTMSSLKTHGVADKKSRTEPPRTVAIHAPAVAASSWLTGAGPRARIRTRHRSSPLMVPVSTQATGIIGAVNTEGARCGATTRNGMRSSDGKIPK